MSYLSDVYVFVVINLSDLRASNTYISRGVHRNGIHGVVVDVAVEVVDVCLLIQFICICCYKYNRSICI